MDQFKIFSSRSDSYQFKSCGSENLSYIWSDNGEEKEPELNENFGVLLAFEPKAIIPVTDGSSILPGDIGLEGKVVEETTGRISHLGSYAKFKQVISFVNALLT